MGSGSNGMKMVKLSYKLSMKAEKNMGSGSNGMKMVSKNQKVNGYRVKKMVLNGYGTMMEIYFQKITTKMEKLFNNLKKQFISPY